MKFKSMLHLDDLLGGAVCSVFGAFAYALSAILRRDHSLKTAPRHVLFLKFTGMGSILRASFLLRELKKRYPGVKISFCTFASSEGLVRMYREVDNVLVLRDKNLLTLFYDALRSLVWIWMHKADWTVDLEVHSKFSSAFLLLTTARNRIGFSYIPSRFRHKLYTHLLYWNIYQHVDHCYRELGKLLGLEHANFAPIEPAVREEDKHRLSSLLQELGIRTENRILLLNPNSGPLCLERRWPAENFAKIISLLPEDPGLEVILTGSGGEKIYTDHVLSLARKDGEPKAGVHNLAGKLTLPMLTELMKHAALLVTNDSGPLHLADILGIPVISLWGPSSPRIYGPKGRRHRAYWRPIYCSPCVHLTYAIPCGGDNQCLKRLAWRPVAAEIWKRLGYDAGNLVEKAS